MSPRNGSLPWLLIALITLLTAAAARGDVISLNNGGEIRGQLQQPDQRRTDDEPVVIKTLSGSLVTVRREDIESIKRRRLVLEEYEVLRRKVDDTVDAQWELAQWCLNKRLADERRTHLERIVELNPQHAEARRALGHQLHDGVWMSRDEYMKSRGQVLYRGRYVFPQELEQIKENRATEEAEREWYKKVKMWYGWLDSDRAERRNEAVDELKAITDPHAIPALAKQFRDHPDIDYREFYIGILGNMQGREALQALLYQAVFDAKPVVRTAAIAAIPEERTEEAIQALVRGLKSDLRVVVGRSATALAQLGNDQVVPQLIDALITTHRYRVVVPDTGANTIGFAANGGPAPVTSGLPPDVEIAMMTGQLPYGAVVVPPPNPGAQLRRKTRIEKRTEKNPAVLNALIQLTGEDFSYNRNKWRLWWANKLNNVGKS